MVNLNLLKAKIIENGETQERLAEALHISPSWFNVKIHGRKADLNSREIKFISERYNLSASDIDRIFFSSDVS